MKFVLSLISGLFLVGCNILPKVETVEVKVPVAYVPAPPPVMKPVLLTEKISIIEHGYDGYVKALESDLVMINSYTLNLENIIETYNELSKRNPKENNGDQK